MNLDQHVYCTMCRHFELSIDNIPYCCFDNQCEIRNCDDSMPFSDRPCYDPR